MLILKRIILSALVVSTLCHLACGLLLTINHKQSNIKLPLQPIQLTIHEVAKPTPKPIPTNTPKPDDADEVQSGEDKQKIADKGDAPCSMGWYGGIGITVIGHVITGTMIGYPAANAGLWTGDFILNPPMGQIQGEVGTTVHMLIKRGEEMLEFDIVRGKICYSN